MSRLIWPILIATAITLALVVTAAGEATRIELDYLDEIGNQTGALARSGTAIADVMSRIREISREEFTTLFDGVRTDIDVAVAFVADPPASDSLIPIWSLYRQTVLAWDAGVNGLATSMLLAADNPEELAVVDLVGDALADLRAGDNLFEDLEVEFTREEVPDPITPLVAVRLSPADGGILTLSNTYVAAARASTNGLGLRPGLKISQVLTEPEWQVNVESQPVVPATETITFSAVVSNSGNVRSQPETLAMTLTGGAEPVLAQAEVPALQPNGQTTVSFQPVAVEPDILYEILMELIVSGLDSDRTDNLLRVQFTINNS